MIQVTPKTSFSFAITQALGTQTFRQFLENPLRNFYDEAASLAIAQTLYQNLQTQNSVDLPPTEPQTTEEAQAFLQTIQQVLLAGTASPSLAEIVDQNISNGVKLTSEQKALSIPEPSLGSKTSTMLGYLGRRLVKEVGIPTPPAHLVTDPAAVRALIRDKVVYEVLPEVIDTTERRASYERFHATDLSWSQNAYNEVMDLVSPEVSEHLAGIYTRVLSLNEEYRSLFFREDSGRVPAAEEEYQRAKETRALELKVEQLEVEWQTTLYSHIGDRYIAKASRKEADTFNKAISSYKKSATAYLEYNEQMVGGDKNSRENERKKREEKLFQALWNLHDAALDLLHKVEKYIPITTFLCRTQAYRIDQGPTGMRALEALYELVSRARVHIKDRKSGKISEPEYDLRIATEWALPMLVNAYSGIRIIGRDSDTSFMFRHRTPEEITSIQGADLLFSQNQQREPSQGSVSAWDHTGAFDYCGVIGALYLFGLEPDSIIAEKIFNYIPVMSGHLNLTTGGFLDRKNPSAIYGTMGNNIRRGRSNALFDAGTRLLAFPFISPYAPLEKPGSLFVPNEYIPRRNVAGMHVRYDQIPDAERIMMANNFHVGGVPSPDIPRDYAGFKSPHNMFGYTTLGTRPAFAALARHFKPRDMPQHEGVTDAFHRRQLDVALLRAETTRVGFAADAGPFQRPNGR